MSTFRGSPRSIHYENVLGSIRKDFLDFHGLESLAEDKERNLIYASSKAGKILQLSIDSDLKVFFHHKLREYFIVCFQPVIKKSFDYGAPDRMKRPLGMRFSPWFPDFLYFVDAYQGIFILNTVKSNFFLRKLKENIF